MSDFFESPKQRRLSWPIVGAGVGLTLIVFLLIPMTQVIRIEPPEEAPAERFGIYMPPPPPVPPAPPPPRKDEPDPEPEPEALPPMPSLEQLELELQPGAGNLLEIGSGLDLDFEVESGRTLLELFDFGDLDEIPRITQGGRVVYPPRLQRAGVEGFVRVLVIIEKDGSVGVSEVLDFSDPGFVPPAVRGAEASRFTPPQRLGEPVRARYVWTIEFSLSG